MVYLISSLTAIYKNIGSSCDSLVKMLFIFITALAVFVNLVGGASIPGIVTTEHYNQSAILDKDQKYILFWNNNATHVTFEVHVKTTGFVGFGISDNGDMFPGDVVVGWVKNGTTHFAVSLFATYFGLIIVR